MKVSLKLPWVAKFTTKIAFSRLYQNCRNGYSVSGIINGTVTMLNKDVQQFVMHAQSSWTNLSRLVFKNKDYSPRQRVCGAHVDMYFVSLAWFQGIRAM